MPGGRVRCCPRPPNALCSPASNKKNAPDGACPPGAWCSVRVTISPAARAHVFVLTGFVRLHVTAVAFRDEERLPDEGVALGLIGQVIHMPGGERSKSWLRARSHKRRTPEGKVETRSVQPCRGCRLAKAASRLSPIRPFSPARNTARNRWYLARNQLKLWKFRAMTGAQEKP